MKTKKIIDVEPTSDIYQKFTIISLLAAIK